MQKSQSFPQKYIVADRRLWRVVIDRTKFMAWLCPGARWWIVHQPFCGKWISFVAQCGEDFCLYQLLYSMGFSPKWWRINLCDVAYSIRDIITKHPFEKKMCQIKVIKIKNKHNLKSCFCLRSTQTFHFIIESSRLKSCGPLYWVFALRKWMSAFSVFDIFWCHVAYVFIKI